MQRQRLINTRTLTNGDSDVPVKGGSRRSIENGLSGAERRVNARHDDREAGNETENEDNENNENDEEEEEEDREGPFVPFQCPGTCCTAGRTAETLHNTTQPPVLINVVTVRPPPHVVMDHIPPMCPTCVLGVSLLIRLPSTDVNGRSEQHK